MALELEGFWQLSKFDGDNEFIFNAVKIDTPQDKRALLDYVALRTKGIGPATVERIWQTYGEQWDSANLDMISGLANSVKQDFAEVVEQVNAEKDQTDAITFLMAHNCSMRVASLAWQKWEKQTIATVQSNPFVLAKLPRVGFLKVDLEIRRTFGIEDGDTRRIDACVLYCAEQLSFEIGTAIRTEYLARAVTRLIANAKIKPSVLRLQDDEQLMVIPPEHVAIFSDYKNEAKIWRALVK